MKKLLSIQKATVFAVGLIVLLAIGVGVRLSLWETNKPTPAAEAGSTTLYETKFDSHTLTISSSEASGERVISLNISGGNTRPASLKLEDHWSETADSKIIPLEGGRYGILLFYNTADCESSSSNYVIDLFSYETDIRHIETLTTTEHYPLDDHKSSFYAKLPVSAPYVEGFNTWDFTIPVAIKIGRDVAITPLLTREGTALILQAAAKDRQSIIDKLTQEGKQDELKDYLNAELTLNKALAPRTITF